MQRSGLRKCTWSKTISIEVPAYFHQFGQSFIEFTSGPGLYPIAIIELEDGSVKIVDADSIKFNDL